MSAGLYRKQFEALRAFADGAGIVYTIGQGSFNEKFCELAKDTVNGLGGTFSATAGSFATRKALYLYQIAQALGMSGRSQGTMRELMLEAAKYIYDQGNTGDTPTTGASLDWRTYQYLLYAIAAVFPTDGLEQYITGVNDGVDTFEDQTANGYDLEMKQSNCLDCSGDNVSVKTGIRTPSSDDIHIEVYIKTSAVHAGCFFDSGGFSTGTSGIGCRVQLGKVELWMAKDTPGVPNLVLTSGTKRVDDNQWHKVEIDWNRSTLDATVTIDGVEDQSGTSAEDMPEEENTYAIGSYATQTGDFFTGYIHGFKVTGNGDYQLAEGAGDKAYNRWSSTGTEIEVIVFAGQSNMRGSSGAPPSPYDVSMNNYLYYYDVNVGLFRGDAQPLSKLDADDWSGELPCGYLLNQNYGEKTRAVIKWARDGQQMETFNRDNGFTVGYNYRLLIERINSACEDLISQGYSPKITNFVWMQGESDTVVQADADDYYDNFYGMWDGLVEETFITKDTQVRIVGVAVPTRTYRATVRAFQSTIGSELGSYIEGEDWDLNIDDVHYTNTGRAEMGEDFYAAIPDYTSAGTTTINLADEGSNIENAVWAQDDIKAYNMVNGFSKILDESGTTEIAVTGLAGTEAITSTGTGSVVASAGKLTLSGGYVTTISIDGVLTYRIANAYGTTLPSANETWPDGTLTGGDLINIPSLQSGSDDALGLGLTNPAVGAGVMHNNAETLLQQVNGNEAALGHSDLYYEVDETTEKQVSYADLKAWVSGTEDTWIGMAQNEGGTCVVTGSAIYTEGKAYSIGDYNGITTTLPNTCGAGQIEPLRDESGTVILDNAGDPIFTLP